MVRISGQPRLADVEKRDDLGMAVRDDVAGEGAEGGCPRAAGIHDRRDSGVDTGEVGVDAGAADAIEDVCVQVDQAGRNDLAGDVDRPRGPGAVDIRSDTREHAVLHGDVVNAVEPHRRIDDRPALEQQIVHVVPLSGPARRHTTRQIRSGYKSTGISAALSDGNRKCVEPRSRLSP